MKNAMCLCSLYPLLADLLCNSFVCLFVFFFFFFFGMLFINGCMGPCLLFFLFWHFDMS